MSPDTPCPACLNGCGGTRADCPRVVGEPTPDKRGVGRPTLYRPEFAAQAEKLCRLGATDIELADFFGVHRDTIHRWSQVYDQFSDALKAGKQAADERVERSLYAKAIGYSFDAVKIMQHDGAVIEAPYREHVPPDTTAAIFWLKNRRPKDWRDKRDLEHSGPDGGPVRMVWGDGGS